MDVTIVSNGILQMIVSKPKGSVQAAALAEFQRAVANSQKVAVGATEEGIVLSVEG